MVQRRFFPGYALATLFVAILAGSMFITALAQGQGKVIPPEDDVQDVDIMLEKLHAAQNVLTALVMRDGESIASSGHKLAALCKADAWHHVENDPVYTHFSVEFQRQAEHLARMGEAKNLEGAAYVYQGLTATCVACHEHVRDVTPIRPVHKP
jgi:hypothetical protein